MVENQLAIELETFFTGLHTTQETIKNIQEVYNPTVAFKFNSLNFFRPGENKISQILAFFLDPSESHGQGRTFLDLFISDFVPELCDTCFSDVKVYTEYPIENSRRIDILVVFDKWTYAFGIENKIWAKDQNDQIIDYSRFLEKEYQNNYVLFYLTPYKKAPSTLSISEADHNKLMANKKLLHIDYSTQIISLLKKWILHCRAERVKSFLMDFEQFLQQEINGQSFMKEFEIVADYILKNEERVKTAFLVEGAAKEVKQAILEKFNNQLAKLAEEQHVALRKNTLEKQYGGFKFDIPLLSDLNIAIGFEFQEKWHNNLIFGIIKSGIVEENLLKDIQQKLQDAFPLPVKSHSNEFWPWYTPYEEYHNWNNATYIAIYDGQLINDISKKVNKIIGVLSSCKSAFSTVESGHLAVYKE